MRNFITPGAGLRRTRRTQGGGFETRCARSSPPDRNHRWSAAGKRADPTSPGTADSTIRSPGGGRICALGWRAFLKPLGPTSELRTTGRDHRAEVRHRRRPCRTRSTTRSSTPGPQLSVILESSPDREWRRRHPRLPPLPVVKCSGGRVRPSLTPGAPLRGAPGEGQHSPTPHPRDEQDTAASIELCGPGRGTWPLRTTSVDLTHAFMDRIAPSMARSTLPDVDPKGARFRQSSDDGARRCAASSLDGIPMR